MSRKGNSGGNSGGVISSLRSIIGGGKEPGPKHDDDADECDGCGEYFGDGDCGE